MGGLSSLSKITWLVRERVRIQTHAAWLESVCPEPLKHLLSKITFYLLTLWKFLWLIHPVSCPSLSYSVSPAPHFISLLCPPISSLPTPSWGKVLPLPHTSVYPSPFAPKKHLTVSPVLCAADGDSFLSFLSL